MKNGHRRYLFGITLFAAILIASGGAWAQEESQEQQPGVEEEKMEVPVAVGEITVTAQKREENIQDVPVSVSTLQGEDLAIITTGGVDIRAL